MSEEKKLSRREISFLPPLKMLLAFFERETQARPLKKDDTQPVNTKGYDVKRIIDRLKKKDEQSD
jgi:hypothetical protein